MKPCLEEEATDIELRPFRDEADLDKMRAILVKGREARGPTYYVHVGDLNWWVFYLDQDEDLRQRAHLWERRQDGVVVGWALVSPRFSAFDLFVHPEVWDTGRAESMFAWAEEWASDIVQERGGTSLQTVWISEHDTRLIAHLQSRGFARSDGCIICMQRELDRGLLQPALPHGFSVRPVAGEHEARPRAAASHAAFGSSQLLGRYQRRYLAFMRSPVYTPKLDLVAVAPDGRIAAFCICWLDGVNRVGHLEPVGTHPDFQRRKLGTAVLQAALWRMAEHGMMVASVCVESSNVAGQAFYSSAGFRPLFKLLTFTKPL
jgi:ribosomal protein S18 acetylase RimI-like enzyme